MALYIDHSPSQGLAIKIGTQPDDFSVLLIWGASVILQVYPRCLT